MPRTRAQRRHALATALDEDTLSYILSFLPKLGVVPGRLYTLAGGARAKTGKQELSLKAILAPRRRRLIKCPDDIPRLEDAVAAAREGDVVLLTESVELQAPIIAPPFHVTIAAVSRRRFGRLRPIEQVPPGQKYGMGTLSRVLDRPSNGAHVYVNTNNFPGYRTDDSDIEESSGASLAAAVVASGGKVHLKLHGIAWVGAELENHEQGIGVGLTIPLVIDAQEGASVEVENCWISNAATAALRASSGSRIFVRDAHISRSVYGVLAQGDGSTIIVENCLLNGGHVFGASAYRGGRVDVRSCCIDCCRVGGVCSKGESSHIRIRETMYMSRRTGEDAFEWSPRFIAREGGSVTFSATENDTYEWVSATFEDDGGELIEGDGGDLEGFEDLSGGDPEPVLSLRYPANDGFDYLSHVREGIEHQEQSRFGWDGSPTYIDA